MAWHTAFSWLVYSAIASFVLLCIGAALVRWRRQPIERLWIVQLTLLACLAAPLLNKIPGVPQVALNWLSPPTENEVVPAAKMVQADQPVSAADVKNASSQEKAPEKPIDVAPQMPAAIEKSAPPPSTVASNDRLENGAQNPETAETTDPTPPKSEQAEAPMGVPIVRLPPRIAKTTPATESKAPESKASAPAAVPTSKPTLAANSLPDALPALPWKQIVVVLYGVGIGICCLWYLIGFVVLSRLNSTALPVPDAIAKLFHSLAGTSNKLKARLCMSPRVELPLAFGIRRPTILLPQHLCQQILPLPRGEGRGEGAAAQLIAEHATPLSDKLPLSDKSPTTSTALRYALAHEWSHLSRGDVLRWEFCSLAGVLLFYQPLYWWLRRQMRLCQDYLADAEAASATLTPNADGTNAAANHADFTREDYAQFLVNLAHRRIGLPAMLALSVGDGKSNLYHRVQMLLQTRLPLLKRASGVWKTGIAVLAICAVCFVGAFRLTAEDQPKNVDAKSTTKSESGSKVEEKSDAKVDAKSTAKSDEKSDAKSSAPPTKSAETLTVVGTVQDALIGKPLAGAKVTIWKLKLPESKSKEVLKRIEVVTNDDGKFTFELPTDNPYARQVSSSNTGNRYANVLPVEIEVKQSNYAPIRISTTVPVSDDAATDANRAQSVREGFSPIGDVSSSRRLDAINLRPSKSVTGVLQSPEGNPVPGVLVFADSQVPRNEREIPTNQQGSRLGGFPEPSKDFARTDASGRFELEMITPGEGMLSAYPEKDFAPYYNVLYDRRGDLGVIKLDRGAQIKGRVLDAEGKPLGGAYINSNLWNPPERKYSSDVVSQSPHRMAIADANGNFTIAPLGPGEYDIEPNRVFSDRTVDTLLHPAPTQDVPGLFVPQKLTIAPGQTKAEIELRAVPTVTISGSSVDPNMADGNLSMEMRQNAPYVEGTFNGIPFTASFKGDGRQILATVPRGLTDASARFRPSDSRSRGQATAGMPQWRLKADDPFTSNPELKLGTVDADVSGIEIAFTRFGIPGGTTSSRGRGRGTPNSSAPNSSSTQGTPQPNPSATQATNSSTSTESKPATDENPQPLPSEITVSGFVLDAETEKPIEGAAVTFWEY
ncbi:MAG TPA: hypothetical protein VGJ15_04170, partial [Pirellulales bacterium]